jgi:ABC-2 type transport system ATP-binding protein
MNRGRLIALDRPHALRARLTEPILEIATDHGPAAAQALQGAPRVIEAALFGRAVHALVEDAAAATRELPALLAARGIAVRGITPVRPSLEDVFVALVRREGGVVAG